MKKLQFKGMLLATAVLALGLMLAGCGHGTPGEVFPATGSLTVNISTAVDYPTSGGKNEVRQSGATKYTFTTITADTDVTSSPLPAGSYTFRYKVTGDDQWKNSPAFVVPEGGSVKLTVTKNAGTLTYAIE